MAAIEHSRRGAYDPNTATRAEYRNQATGHMYNPGAQAINHALGNVGHFIKTMMFPSSAPAAARHTGITMHPKSSAVDINVLSGVQPHNLDGTPMSASQRQRLATTLAAKQHTATAHPAHVRPHHVDIGSIMAEAALHNISKQIKASVAAAPGADKTGRNFLNAATGYRDVQHFARHPGPLSGLSAAMALVPFGPNKALRLAEPLYAERGMLDMGLPAGTTVRDMLSGVGRGHMTQAQFEAAQRAHVADPRRNAANYTGLRFIPKRHG